MTNLYFLKIIKKKTKNNCIFFFKPKFLSGSPKFTLLDKNVKQILKMSKNLTTGLLKTLFSWR